MVQLIEGLGADLRGARHVDPHAALPAHYHRHAGSEAGRAPARFGPADGTAPRPYRPRPLRAAGRRLPDPPHDRNARAGARRARRHVVSETGYELDAPNGLKGASFYLDEASVTGTETAILAAAAAEGVTEIRHAATEPHVVELCELLQAMGVEIEGGGTSTIRIQGASKRRARDASAERRLHRGRELGGRGRDHRRRRRRLGRARHRHGADHVGARPHAGALRFARRRVHRPRVEGRGPSGR